MLAKLFVWLTMAGLFIWNAGALEQKIIEALPPGIPSCQNVTTSIDVCIRNAFNTMLKGGKKGIPELNLPPIDPLMLDKLKIAFSNEILRGKAMARDVKIYGFSESNIDDLKYQSNGTHIRLDIHLLCPKLQVNAAYRAKITINNAEIMSRGVLNFTITDIDSQSQHYSEIYEQNNQTFIRTYKVDFAPKLGHVNINATGLVPEPALNDALLEVLNSNWRSISESILPAIHSTIEPILNNLSNEIFSRIPLDLILKV